MTDLAEAIAAVNGQDDLGKAYAIAGRIAVSNLKGDALLHDIRRIITDPNNLLNMVSKAVPEILDLDKSKDGALQESEISFLYPGFAALSKEAPRIGNAFDVLLLADKNGDQAVSLDELKAFSEEILTQSSQTGQLPYKIVEQNANERFR